MKFFQYGFLVVFGLFTLIFSVSAQQIPTLDFFHGRECPHCQNQQKWFPTLKKAYPDIVINEYEVWHDGENQALWATRLAEIGEAPSGVPSNIIGAQLVTGFAPDRILEALAAAYGPPAVDITSLEAIEEDSEGLDLILIAIVLGGMALAAGIAFLGKKS